MNTNRSSDSDPRDGAFTLLELLVVIGMVGLWALMLLPALARTAVRNPALQCMNNLQQLQRASAMYAADNNGRLAANLGSFLYSFNAWCTGVLDWGQGYGAGSLGESVPPNLNTNYLLNAQLGPYTGSRASVYKCPADKVPSAVGPRVRSYSMNGFVGGTAEQTVYGYTTYRTFLKDSDFTAPAPRQRAGRTIRRPATAERSFSLEMMIAICGPGILPGTTPRKSAQEYQRQVSGRPVWRGIGQKVP